MKGSELLSLVETMALIGYALPSPDQLEFTLADPSTCDLPALPSGIKADVVQRLSDESVVIRMVVTELGSHGTGVAAAVIVPPKGAKVISDQDRD